MAVVVVALFVFPSHAVFGVAVGCWEAVFRAHWSHEVRIAVTFPSMCPKGAVIVVTVFLMPRFTVMSILRHNNPWNHDPLTLPITSHSIPSPKRQIINWKWHRILPRHKHVL